MLVLLVAAAKILTVKAGTSIDPAFAYHVGPAALFVPATRTLVELDFMETNIL
jgi:hypothetical protein